MSVNAIGAGSADSLQQLNSDSVAINSGVKEHSRSSTGSRR